MKKVSLILSIALAAPVLVLGACKSTEEKKVDTRRVPPNEPWRNDRPKAGEAAAPAFPARLNTASATNSNRQANDAR